MAQLLTCFNIFQETFNLGLTSLSALGVIGVVVELVARGDLTPVIARLQFRGLAERWLAKIQSEG